MTKKYKTHVGTGETKRILVSYSVASPEPVAIVKALRGAAGLKSTFSVLRKPSGPFAWVALVAAVFLVLLTVPLGRAHESPPGCTGSGLGIDLFANIGDVHVGDTIRYSVRIFNSPFPACDASGIQASVTTPDGVSNSITSLLIRRTLTPSQSDFYTNVVTYVVRAQDVRSDGTVRATAQDNGDIHQNDTDSRGGGNQGVNTEVDFPCINVVVNCTGNSNGTISYSGSVVNCGNTPLGGMTVSNLVNGALVYVTGPVNIAINQSINFSGSWIPAIPCSPSTAIILVQGTDVTAHSSNVVASASITCSIITTPGIKVTKVCPPQAVSPGQIITFSGSVSNTGNVTLTNIVVVNDQPVANTVVFAGASLAPGQVVAFTGSYTAPENCSTTSTLTANGSSVCGGPVTGSASSTCPITTTPDIAVTLNCPATPIISGGAATYTGTVRNSGNITLNNVSVSQIGQPLAPTSGLVGYWALNETSGNTATDSSGTGNNGNIVNATRTAGQSGNGLALNGTSGYVDIANNPTVNFTGPITMSAWIHPQASDGLRNILAHGFSATSLAEVSLRIRDGQYQAGANNGAANPRLSVPMPSGDLGTWVHLAATFDGSIWTLYRNGVVIGSSSDDTGPVNVNANWAIGARGGGGERFFSGAIDEVRLYNRGLTRSEIVSLSSGSPLLFSTASMAPGATASFTLTDLADTCSLRANLSATGRDSCTSLSVTNTTSVTCPVPTIPVIVVTLACPTVPVAPGAVITYTGTVRNSGNITLTNVTVTDTQSSPATVLALASLAPGITASFSASFNAPFDACTVSSTVTARGNDACTANVVSDSASATCPIVTTPNLVVTKNCPQTPVTPGGVLTYSGTVSNSGAITLANVSVLNDRSGSTPVFAAATLAPGASANFTGSYTVPINSACSITSTLTASAADNCSGVRVSVTASGTCPLLTVPAIEVTQACPSTPSLQGSLLTYTGTVRNTGNVTLTNVIVVNNRPAANTVVFTVATLAPGTTANFTGSYIVPLNCCSVSSSLKATGKDICTGVTVTDTQTATCPVLTSPRLTVRKICATEPWKTVGPGDVLEYSGMVSNAGNITLTGVTVVNDHPSAGSLVFGPVILAPGEFANYTGSYTIPMDFCGTDTVTARGLDSCTDAAVTASTTTTCPVTTTPRIAITKNCPAQPTPRGGMFTFTGTVSNPGDVTLTNVFVTDSMPAPNTAVIGPITLAPGASRTFSGSFIAPTDCCEIMDTVTAHGTDRCSGTVVSATASAICPLLTTPSIAITQNCPGTPVAIGSVLTYGGSVRNSGDVNLTNVYVYNSEATAAVTGPLELAPGQTESYTGSYVVKPKGSFGTIGLTGGITDRFGVPANYQGLAFADPDKGYGATQFYSVHKDDSGPNYTFDTMSGPGTITHRFSIVLSGIDGITFAAPDVGYGPVNFYYVRHDNTGVSSFGVIKPGGTVGTATDLLVAGPNFDAITFAAPDVGFGANLFYYLRHDSSGRSFFGTINPALPGTITDRFSGTSIGNNFDALVFVATDVGNGPNRFYYLRHRTDSASTLGYIAPTATAGVVADRFSLGAPFSELTFATTDVGYGANLFYYLRTSGYDPARAATTGSFVTVTGADTCQGRSVTGVANCAGSLTQPVIAPLVMNENGSCTITWSSTPGTTYMVQSKNSLNTAWTNIPGNVTAEGATATKSDTTTPTAQRFYRVMVVQ